MDAGFESRFGDDHNKENDKRYDDLWKEVGRRSHGPTVEAKTFTSTQLRRIGEVCSKRLPPASTVQAMFMYELQRESEVESLFQDQMFRLAKHDNKSAEQEKRIAALEARLSQMEKAAASKDVEERLATSKLTMKVQQGRVDACTKKVHELGTRIEKELDALRSKQEEAATQRVDEKVISGPDTQTMAEEINGILEIITEFKNRLITLENKTRALTIAGTTIKTPSVSPQLIPVQNSKGEVTQYLSIPKGKAHVSMKEDRKPSAIRSFSPGKQWAA